MAWFNLGKALDKKGDGWSMRRLSQALGVRPQAVTKYFKPGFDPSASTLLKWAQALDCSLDDLLDDSLSEKEKHMPRPSTATEREKKRTTTRKKARK